MAKLTEEQRRAVVLRVEFDYSHPQIAEAMGEVGGRARRSLKVRESLVQTGSPETRANAFPVCVVVGQPASLDRSDVAES